MSWEGYGQVLCKNGHQYTVGAYDGENDPCPDCGAAQDWVHWVDQTNGCYCPLTDGSKCPAHPLELRIKTPEVVEECSQCHHKKRTQPATYFKPEEGK